MKIQPDPQSKAAFATGLGLITVSASFTRPNNTTAYAANQLVANNTVAANVVPLAFDLSAFLQPGATATVNLARVRIAGQTALITGAIAVSLFNALPTPTVGDGGAFVASSVLATNDEAGFQGQLTTVTNFSMSDGTVTYGGTSTPVFTLAPGSAILYALLNAAGAWTPVANGVVTVELIIRP